MNARGSYPGKLHRNQRDTELQRVGTELASSQRRAERAEAEAALARQLLAELRGALHELDGGGRRRGATPKESRHGRSP